MNFVHVARARNSILAICEDFTKIGEHTRDWVHSPIVRNSRRRSVQRAGVAR